jgi:hypothetical protein
MSRSTTRGYRAAIRVGLVLALVVIVHARPFGDESIGTIRPRLDVTAMTDATTTVPAHLITPAMAQNIGPGSHLLISIPGEGTFGCTANFVWTDATTRYLGAAGHCFIPAGATATHGPGADYNASGVVVQVCVSNCSFGGQTGFTITGDLVQLGTVAYARQTGSGGDIGNDFGVVVIPSTFAGLVRPSMPVFSGPTSVDQIDQGELVCHYGNGVIVGETFPTMARVGIGGGSGPASWMGDLIAAPGDSGSAVVTCDSDITGFHGRGAAGILTHISAQVCPCDVGSLTFQQGVVFGTTVARAIQMAGEAGLSLALVVP